MQCRDASWIEGWKCQVTGIKPGSNAGIRVQRPVGSLLPADCQDDKRLEERRKVRALSHFAVIARLAFTSPAKTVTIQMPFIVRVMRSNCYLKTSASLSRI